MRQLKRLYKMVEDGLTDSDEILRERITLLKRDRDRAKTALDRIKAPSLGRAGARRKR